MTEEERIDELEEALWRILQWTDAYPSEIFTEVNSQWLKKAHATLKRDAQTTDLISAHVGRHCLKGVADIARAALDTLNKDG